MKIDQLLLWLVCDWPFCSVVIPQVCNNEFECFCYSCWRGADCSVWEECNTQGTCGPTESNMSLRFGVIWSFGCHGYSVKTCMFSCKSRNSVYVRITTELGAGYFICRWSLGKQMIPQSAPYSCPRIGCGVRYGALSRAVKNRDEIRSYSFILIWVLCDYKVTSRLTNSTTSESDVLRFTTLCHAQRLTVLASHLYTKKRVSLSAIFFILIYRAGAKQIQTSQIKKIG